MCGATVNVLSDCLRKKRPRRRTGTKKITIFHSKHLFLILSVRVISSDIFFSIQNMAFSNPVKVYVTGISRP